MDQDRSYLNYLIAENEALKSANEKCISCISRIEKKLNLINNKLDSRQKVSSPKSAIETRNSHKKNTNIKSILDNLEELKNLLCSSKTYKQTPYEQLTESHYSQQNIIATLKNQLLEKEAELKEIKALFEKTTEVPYQTYMKKCSSPKQPRRRQLSPKLEYTQSLYIPSFLRKKL